MTKASEKQAYNRSRELFITRALVLILILILLYLWAAYQNRWWPYMQDAGLGNAFTSAEQSKAASSAGATGAAGSSGAASSNGTTPAQAATSSALLTFAAGVNSGDTKADVSGQSSGLNENCLLVASSSSLGKQEVCTYTEGDKIVTVTYLDDQVVSASRRGF